MIKKRFAAIILIAFIATCCLFAQYRKAHTFTLTDEPTADSYLKSEQIQPIFGTVKVWGTQDTDVWFTDVEDPENRFQIGYITSGMSGTIKLEKDKWYIVHGAGDITIQMVNIRIP